MIYIALACIAPLQARFFYIFNLGLGQARNKKKELLMMDAGQETRRHQIGKIRPSGLIYESISAQVM